MNLNIHTEGYRSGHNEAVLKTVWEQSHVGSNPTPSAKINSICFMQVLFFCDVIEGIRRPRVKKQSGGLFFRGTAPSADGRIPHPTPK